jgi:hypothetical protein
MKHVINTILAAGVVGVLSSCATQDTSQYGGGSAYYYTAPARGAGVGWPRRVASGATTYVIYEPMVDSWNGHQLTARSAVEVQSGGQPQPTYGVVAIQALTLVDKTSRTVSLENVHVVGGDFPSAGQRIQDYLKTLRKAFPKQLEGLSLDYLAASLAVAAPLPEESAPPLNNAPPKIIFSTKPAILVYVDGPPVYRPVAETELQRVINSRLLLLKDRAGQCYLRIRDGYMTSPSLKGPWLVASEPPKGAAEAEKQVMASPTPVDLLDGQTDLPANLPPSLTSATAPIIYVATTPTELILFEGQPNFVPIAGTRLLYVANTTGNVFRLLTDQWTYVLLAGRWFRAPSLDGPWQFMPADHLPPDFANIPNTSPKENVKASVPGTQQATEALIANSIPESTKVPRDTQIQPPQFDGPPRFRPIVGTPLYCVVNSGTPIIEVDSQSWYACQNGVWYAASSVTGPWTAATSVPAVIYTIPPSSPLHYLTYVQVYGATPEFVYEGYTPGYWGTEVEDGVVVYGTGYDYPPWVGDVWYGWPCTWGCGWGPCWTPWDDWCFDYGFGWGCGFGGFAWSRCHPPRPWWGPRRDWHHQGGVTAWSRSDTASPAGNIYARQTPRGGFGTRWRAGADPAATYARAYNSRTGALAAGQRASVSNVYGSLMARGGESRFWANHASNSLSSTFGGANNARGFRGWGLSGRVAAGGWRGSSHQGGYSHGFAGAGGYSRGGWGGHGGGGHGGGGGGGGHGGGGGGHG